MEIAEWINSSLYVEVESANLDAFLKEELIETNFNLKELDIIRWKKIPNFVLVLSPFYSLFQVCIWWNLGLAMCRYLRSKQRCTLNIECGDLQLKLTNLQPDICDLLSDHQNHPSH